MEDVAPKTGRTALLILDMINRFDFDGAENLRPRAAAAAEAIAALRDDIEREGLSVIYVNDNFGKWHAEQSQLVADALDRAGEVVGKLPPRRGDFFVIKPQFSGFYATSLPALLPRLGVSRLILAGIATDICVLFTAADAHMREYTLWVPENCVAAEDVDRGRWALEIMAKSMGAITSPSSREQLQEWLRASSKEDGTGGG